MCISTNRLCIVLNEQPAKCFDDENFECFATIWRDSGAKLIGGCCRTTPSTVQAISKVLKGQSQWLSNNDGYILRLRMTPSQQDSLLWKGWLTNENCYNELLFERNEEFFTWLSECLWFNKWPTFGYSTALYLGLYVKLQLCVTIKIKLQEKFAHTSCNSKHHHYRRKSYKG